MIAFIIFVYRFNYFLHHTFIHLIYLLIFQLVRLRGDLSATIGELTNFSQIQSVPSVDFQRSHVKRDMMDFSRAIAFHVGKTDPAGTWDTIPTSPTLEDNCIWSPGKKSHSALINIKLNSTTVGARDQQGVMVNYR